MMHEVVLITLSQGKRCCTALFMIDTLSIGITVTRTYSKACDTDIPTNPRKALFVILNLKYRIRPRKLL